MENFDFKAIIEVIINFLKSLLKFEFPEIGGLLEEKDDTAVEGE